ncbi:MAG: glutathione S-transferase family protein [Proteobacteria bacterium]|nr:glutathione S-transferase family protein [Pseudomonadota bacterium]
MKLYFSHNTRSVRPRWLLEEIGASYQLVQVDLANGEHKSPDFLKLNPNGHVPTFIDGELVIYETTAITLYIADKFIEHHFAPAFGSKERGTYYQLMTYASSLERHLKCYSMLLTAKQLDEALVRQKNSALAEIVTICGEISKMLSKNDYILGNNFSAVDITFFHWLWELEKVYGLINDSIISRYIDRVSKRPALVRANS